VRRRKRRKSARSANANGRKGDNDWTWLKLKFGRHRGKTLPQVICSDPSWFLWAIHEDAFEQPRGYRHLQEASMLYRRLQGIVIPRRRPENWVVEYCYDDGRFAQFDIVRRTDDPYLKYNSQSPCFDLTMVRVRYRREWRNFIRDFRRVFFGGRNLTKRRCERFFSDRSHFVNP
jgi:hypothetical protein